MKQTGAVFATILPKHRKKKPVATWSILFLACETDWKNSHQSIFFGLVGQSDYLRLRFIALNRKTLLTQTLATLTTAPYPVGTQQPRRQASLRGTLSAICKKNCTLDEKTDLHHICAVQMSANLVQSRSECDANGVNATFALDLHGGGKSWFFRAITLVDK